MMDLVFEDFRKAYEGGHGYDLAQTLSPLPPKDQPERLQNFYQSTNFAHAEKDFRYRILHDASLSFKLPKEEGNGWVEVYFCYWKAVGEILNAESGGGKVSNSSSQDSLRFMFWYCICFHCQGDFPLHLNQCHVLHDAMLNLQIFEDIG